jgi:N-acyl-D-amino-acid deacylase
MTNQDLSCDCIVKSASKLLAIFQAVTLAVVGALAVAFSPLASTVSEAKSMTTAKAQPEKLPVTGTPGSVKLNRLAPAVLKLMHKHKITAAEVAVSKNGEIVYSTAFGFSDKEHKTATKPTDLFRIASCSKPITAVTILTLVEQGKLRLDDKVADILKDLKPPDGEPFDKRIDLVTVRQLLEHTSGFSNADGDPQFSLLRVAPHQYGLPLPASAESIVRYRLSQPLNRDPGTKYEYSNFGYNVLGRVIERKTGEGYESYVKKNILAPAGISDMVIGRVRPKDRLPNEVYFDDAGLGGEGWSIYADELKMVPVSYGSLFIMEAMDSHGGWLASAEDLVRFCAAADGSNPKCQLLKPHTIEIMTEPPEVQSPDANKRPNYYAKGWDVNPKLGEWNHSGALTWGTSTYVCHMPDGVQVACVFNHLPYPIGKYFTEMANTILPLVRRCRGEF